MITLYDSASGQKTVFEPLKEGRVSMYVCGPTVYDLPHLGHGRSAVAFDVIRKYFEYCGYKVVYATNYTDIDDKMIKRAAEEKISVKELADKIIPEYLRDYDDLGISRPTFSPRATEFIDAMIGLVKKLEDNGHTYILEDGVYYDISTYKKYGEFSKQKLEDLKMGARIAIDENKKNPYDFVLWKFKKEGEPFWSSPWGEGRPGWHLECSGMTWEIFGDKFDIHAGGLDLKFPHHECEVAQSKGAFGDDAFAKYWLHNGFINVDNEKMSKSLGNFFTLREVFKKYDPQVVRLMFLQTHYRNPINYGDVLLEQAKNALNTLHSFIRHNLNSGKAGQVSKNVEAAVGALKKDFESYMNEDFNTSGALSVIFEFTRTINLFQKNLTARDIDYITAALKHVDTVLGVIFPVANTQKLDSELDSLIKEREEARKNKDFETSDKIRDELKLRGIELEDTPKGTLWRRI